MNVTPPTRLSKDARKKFRELSPYYRLSTPLLIDCLAEYCEQWERYVKAGKEADAAPATTAQVGVNGATQQHAAISVQNNCLTYMLKLEKILSAATGTTTTKTKATLADDLDLDD